MKGTDKMQHWKAHYKDALHDADIIIINTEEDYAEDPLSFTLDGITFRGASISSFQLADEMQYEEAKEKFSLLKWGGHNKKFHINMPYSYDLQRYALAVEIPVSVYRKSDGGLVSGAICFAYQYREHDMAKPQCIYQCDDVRVYRDDVLVSDFSLHVDGTCYESSCKTVWFDNALKDICTRMKKEYYLKCCFTCQYSDYSPYGNDDYGAMFCYRRHKEDCLMVNSKEDYFKYLEGKDSDGRQETYLCEQYSPRSQAGGYRGFVDGVPDGQSLYQLIFCDEELSYEEYKEEFTIGIFSSLDKARETAAYYASHIDGFKDYDCSYRIVEKKVSDSQTTGAVYIIFGWNENQNCDAIEIIESECFTQEEAAKQHSIELQERYGRSNWCIDKFTIDACLWKEGFVRV